MDLRVLPFPDIPPGCLENIREIFFLSSSRQVFADAGAKEAFFRHWTSYYFEAEPNHVLVALSAEGRVLGYLTGCTDSASAARRLEHQIPGYSVFQDLFATYPAHLHINCHPDVRGRGIGSRLIREFIASLPGRGIHIVTSPDAANCGFYRRNGFTFELTREWRGKQLLFMGKNR